jgi:hypothetical protein
MGFSGRIGIIRRMDRIIDIIRDGRMGAAKATNTDMNVHPGRPSPLKGESDPKIDRRRHQT